MDFLLTLLIGILLLILVDLFGSWFESILSGSNDKNKNK